MSEPAAAVGADGGSPEVRAAGGVVWRRDGAILRILVVHRPHRADWSLPKGKVDPGESLEETARREVLEETGYVCSLGTPLGTVSYRDNKGRSKTVWYWAMAVEDGDEQVNDEVDEMRWLSPADARATVSYADDREVIDRFTAALEAR
jgi:8-oxo-dGTP pyrophosphatase MutT (NUDIX family)